MRESKLNRYAGFSLVEMAIVMVIFGLIIGGLIGPMQLQLNNMDRKETEGLIEQAKKTIVSYALRMGHIPCPDTNNDGQEDRAGASCSNAGGLLPWVTLGINQTDAWLRPLTYRVDTRFADTNDGTGCPDTDTPGISFEICSRGNITVLDNSGGNLVAEFVPAIIVSHGKNWSAAGDLQEQENSDNDSTFVDRNHINNGYDDHVGWVNINSLIGRMVSIQKLP